MKITVKITAYISKLRYYKIYSNITLTFLLLIYVLNFKIEHYNPWSFKFFWNRFFEDKDNVPENYNWIKCEILEF